MNIFNHSNTLLKVFYDCIILSIIWIRSAEVLNFIETLVWSLSIDYFPPCVNNIVDAINLNPFEIIWQKKSVAIEVFFLWLISRRYQRSVKRPAMWLAEEVSNVAHVLFSSIEF